MLVNKLQSIQQLNILNDCNMVVLNWLEISLLLSIVIWYYYFLKQRTLKN